MSKVQDTISAESAAVLPLKLVRNISYPTYQLYATIANERTNPATALRIAVLETMKWLRERFREHELPPELAMPLPEDHLQFGDGDLRSFRIGGGYLVEVVYLQHKAAWALHLVEPDLGPSPGHDASRRPPTPGRLFETNIAFRVVDDRVECGIQTICSEPEGTEVECEVYRPAVVRRLVSNPHLGFRQIIPLDGKATQLQSIASLERLKEFIQHAGRQLPIIVLSEMVPEPSQSIATTKTNATPEEVMQNIQQSVLSQLPGPLHTQSLFPQPMTKKQEEPIPVVPDIGRKVESLAWSLVAFAHLYILPVTYQEAFTRLMGKANTIANGDIRVFYPSDDEPSFLLSYKKHSKNWLDAVANLKEQLTQYPKYRPVNYGKVIFHAQARVDELQHRESLASSIDDVRRAMTERIGAMQEQFEQQKALETGKLHEENRRLQKLLERLQRPATDTASLEQMEQQFSQYRERVSKQAEQQNVRCSHLRWAVSHFATLSQFEALVQEHPDMKERLIITAKAKQCLNRGDFRDFALLLESLCYLTYEFWELKMNRQEDELAYDRSQDRLEQLGLTLVPHHTDEDVKKYGHTKYHLKNENKTPSGLLRIYFSWHEKKQKVEIKQLPYHWDDGTQ